LRARLVGDIDHERLRAGTDGFRHAFGFGRLDIGNRDQCALGRKSPRDS
jgi:hypothetical protein